MMYLSIMGAAAVLRTGRVPLVRETGRLAKATKSSTPCSQGSDLNCVCVLSASQDRQTSGFREDLVVTYQVCLTITQPSNSYLQRRTLLPLLLPHFGLPSCGEDSLPRSSPGSHPSARLQDRLSTDRPHIRRARI